LGPPTDEGFFYEMSLPEQRYVQRSDRCASAHCHCRAVTQGDYSPLEQLSKDIVKEKQPFERLVMSKADLLKMFDYNHFKLHMINTKIPDGESTTVYRCGPMIDLCVGPHIPHTGRIKAMAILKNSASYFLGDANNESLQRIYGISFPENKAMTEYKKFLEEAAARDHRKIGRVGSFCLCDHALNKPRTGTRALLLQRAVARLGLLVAPRHPHLQRPARDDT
jgi:threonyl-tRNA synthetase